MHDIACDAYAWCMFVMHACDACLLSMHDIACDAYAWCMLVMHACDACLWCMFVMQVCDTWLPFWSGIHQHCIFSTMFSPLRTSYLWFTYKNRIMKSITGLRSCSTATILDIRSWLSPPTFEDRHRKHVLCRLVEHYEIQNLHTALKHPCE